MSNRKNKRGKSIFTWILIPMCILLLIEMALFAGSIAKCGVGETINRNQAQIVQEKVKSRKTYLETEMLGTWSSLNDIIQKVNGKAQQAEQEGQIDLSKADQGSASCEVLLKEISGDLIETLRAKKVTGVFVVFNNEPITGTEGTPKDKPGLYIRDSDPTTNSSEKNSDLLMERGSVELVRTLGISTDQSWSPTFEFAQHSIPYYSFLTETYQQGLRLEDGELLSHAGYWSSPYNLYGDEKNAISYSLPLRTDDGRVYGVLGVEILTDYLETLLPSEEINDQGEGSYVLAVQGTDEMTYHVTASSGKAVSLKENETVTTEKRKNDIFYNDNFCAMEQFTLYDTNTAFVGQKWALIGMVPETIIDAFSARIMEMILLALLITAVFGAAATMIVSYLMASPIKKLSERMDKADPSDVLELSRTKIKEIDYLEESIEGLSSKLKESSAKFTKILELASVKIAAYELNTETNELFVTSNFFELFGKWEVQTETLNAAAFITELKLLEEFRQPIAVQDGELYKVLLGDGVHYIKIKKNDHEIKRIGLAEDVTNSIVERQMIEHERDYDLLTGLRNRRAFKRKMDKLFTQGEDILKHAALIMIDLDNLKQINDTYGHDTGDKYIQCAANAFRNYSPKEALAARISGDEFYLFYYGYESDSEVEEYIEQLRRGIGKEQLELPDGSRCRIQLSGGYAWYSKDTKDYEELLKYSDFAMYQVKHSVKGSIKEFDAAVYQKEMYFSKNKVTLTEMIEHMAVKYYFQPIVEAWSGKVFGYEALMRGEKKGLNSPADILELAKREKKLMQIEALTWFKALESYVRHLKSGQIHEGCKVFINSLPAVHLNQEQIQSISEQYHDYLKYTVLELTEEEKIDQSSLEVKQKVIEEWNAEIALDDFGSGYNGEAVLLQIAPRYIKIDRSIISGIDRDTDKRKLVANLISYAKLKQMRVIAEGVETLEEAHTVVELGVDYLQGFYIARPDLEPPIPSDEVCYYLKQWNEISVGDEM